MYRRRRIQATEWLQRKARIRLPSFSVEKLMAISMLVCTMSWKTSKSSSRSRRLRHSTTYYYIRDTEESARVAGGLLDELWRTWPDLVSSAVSGMGTARICTFLRR